MRRLLAALALLAAPLLAPLAQSNDSIVTISSTRSARIPADRGTTYIIVEVAAETARESTERAAAKAAEVVTAMRAEETRAIVESPLPLGVGITTTRGFGGPPSAPSFTARSTIRVSVTGLGRLQAVLAAALDAGASGSTGTTYSATDTDSTRAELVAQAIAEARDRAEATANALGGRLGALVQVNENERDGFPQPQSYMIQPDNFAHQASALAEVTITVYVTVRYRLQR